MDNLQQAIDQRNYRDISRALMIQHPNEDQFDAIHQLILEAANVNTPKNIRIFLLEIAVHINDADGFNLLLNTNIFQNWRNHPAAFIIREVLNSNNPALVNELLRWVDVNSIIYGKNKTLLQYAASISAPVSIQLLIQNGANVNAQDHNGNTPLHFAVRENEGNLETINILLQNGADTEIKNKSGWHAYDLTNNNEIIDLIMSYQVPDVKEPDTDYDE